MLQICVDNQNERKLKFLTVIDVVNTFCLNLMLIARNMAFSTEKVPFILHGLRDLRKKHDTFSYDTYYFKCQVDTSL